MDAISANKGANGGVSLTLRGARLTRRQFVDAGARWIVSAGGLATIASILAILAFIGAEVAPLARPPHAAVTSKFSLSADRLFAPAVEEYREILQVVTESGRVRFVSLENGQLLDEKAIPNIGDQRVTAVTRSGKDQVLIATTDGRLLAARVAVDMRRDQGKRVLTPRVVEAGSWTLFADGRNATLLGTSRATEAGVTAVFASADSPPSLMAVSETRNLFGAVNREESRRELPLRHGGVPTAIVVDAPGTRAFVATSNGYVGYWDLRDSQAPKLVDDVDATGKRDVAVTAMALLNGDQSIVVGDALGRVSVFFPVRDSALASGWSLQRVHQFAAHHAAVTAIAVSPRDKSFLTADAAGRTLLRHSTSEQTLLELPQPPHSVAALTFAPKANGGLALAADGQVINWEIVNPHPEITLAALFGKQWYEGYDAPAYVWQSTGGTDDFEPKLSLVPLIIGTIKGTLYALLFAMPLAVLAAVYTSQFCHPVVRTFVKPTVEIMAALPSVVLGFLAGLWLAPTIENVVPAVFAMILLLPLSFLCFGALWHSLPAAWRRWAPPGTEVLLLVPLIIIGVQVCLALNGSIERLLFGGDFRVWVNSFLGSRFDQRNCLVVGFAMGFAVIPIIFTISEDALSNVPQRLRSASLALGATPWQTAVRVVLPTASPGIFSAIMVGFGRAVGETMIVLMATGNTPVLDWSPFTGMRTLSANIAVEIPEAPLGSTLYRILFLAALLLFIATFLANTAAELVRQRLRQRYQQL
jgi:phosphate transport system permease protein